MVLVVLVWLYCVIVLGVCSAIEQVELRGRSTEVPARGCTLAQPTQQVRPLHTGHEHLPRPQPAGPAALTFGLRARLLRVAHLQLVCSTTSPPLHLYLLPPCVCSVCSSSTSSSSFSLVYFFNYGLGLFT